MTEELAIRIVADDKTKAAFSSVNSSVKKLGKLAIGGFAVGMAAAAGGVFMLSRELSEATALAKEQRDVEIQLAAVLRSTGGAAQLTSQQLKDYASELQGMTNFGDEAIIGAENLLLTFTNIKSEVFQRTLPAILDLSQAMGQDLKQSTLQVGKALNEPITGLSALREVGIQFTEQQEKQIKVMTEAGNVAAAQGVLLAELERQFGGSAEAMADPAIQLANSFGDMKESIGSVSLLIKTELAKAAMPLLEKVMEKVNIATGKFPFILEKIKTLVKDLMGGKDGMHGMIQVIYSVGDAFGFSDDTLKRVISKFVDLWGRGKEVWAMLVDGKNKVMEFLEPVRDWIKENVTVSDGLAVLGVSIGAVVIPAVLSLASSLLPVIAGAAALFAGVKLLKKGWNEDWNGMQTKLRAFWEDTAKPALISMGEWLGENIPKAIDGLKKAWNWIRTDGKPIIDALVLAFKVSLLPALTLIKVAWGAWTGGFDGVKKAIKEIIGYVSDLGSELADLVLPDWMTPGSPTPWENGLVGVSNAMGYLNNTSIPQLNQNMQDVNHSVVTNNYNLSLAGGRSSDSVRQDFETQKAIAGIP